MLFSKNLSKEASTLTKWLVSIPSVAHAKGPSLINQAIYEGLREFPYFKNHQEHLTLITHDDGTYDDEFAAAQARRHSKSSVVALVKSLEEVSDTLVLLCDTDTSSPYHYGMFKGSSTSCDELALKLRQLAEQGAVSSKIEEILQSDSGLFGLGILESKCATGAMIAVLKELSDNYVHLNLNILFVCTSESSLQHRGIKQCIPFIQKLCTQENLKLRLAVNAKPNTPTGRRDDQLHIYAGSYGKVEPSFYIIGHSATAFRPYAGFSASIIASELIRELELNPKLTQRLHHQPLVPTFDSLRVKEFGKDFSPDGMQVSFSLPLLDLDLGALLEVLKEVAATAIEHAADLVDQREASFAQLKREDFIPETKDAEVISFSDLVERAKHNFQGNLDKALAGMVQKCRHEGLSLHQASITIIERLNEIAHLPRPSIVIYYTDNYVPPMGLEERSSQDRELYMMLEGLIARMKQLGTIVPSMAPYYAPTDGNFLRPVGVGPALRILNEECPVRAQELSTLNVPTITLGIAGDDLTLLTEHVDRDMCEYLPQFLLNLVDLLAQPENALQLEYHNDLSHHLAELGKKAESIASASVREIQTINQQNASTGFYAQVSQGTLTPHSLSSFLRPSATSEHDARPALEHKDVPLSLPLASAEARADFVPTADLIESGDATTTAAIETVEAEDVTTVPAHATARDPARDAASQLTLQESAASTSENADKSAPDAARSSAGKDEDKGEGKGYLPLRAVKSLLKKAQEAKQALEDNIQAGSVASDSDSPLHAVAAHHYKGTGKQESATATPSAIDVALEAATAIAQMVNQEQDQAQAQAQSEPEPADIDALAPFAAATPAASKSEPAPKTETKAADSQAASDAQTTSERDDEEEAELVVTPVASAVTAKPTTRPEPKSKKGKKKNKNAKQKAEATRAQRAAPTAAADGVTAAGAAAAEVKADAPQAPVSEAPAPEAALEPVTTAEPQATKPTATEPDGSYADTSALIEPELALAAVTEMPTIESEPEPEPKPEPEPLEERAAAAEEQPTAPSQEASAETSAESSAPADAAAVGATQQAETANSTLDTAAPTSTADATADATRGDADTAAAEADSDAAAASDKMAAATAHRNTEPDAVVEPDNEAEAKSAEPAPEAASEQPALAAEPTAEAESETDSPAADPAAQNQADATQPPAPDHEAERPARAPDASAAPEDAPPESEADAGADSKPQDSTAKADEAAAEVAPQDLFAALAAAPVIATATSAQTESGPAPTDFFAQAQAAHPTELTQAEPETELETEPEATSAETTHALAPEAKSPTKAAAAVKPEAEAATEAKAEPPAATSSASEPAVAEEAESEPTSAAPDLAADTASEHAAQDANDTDLAFEEVAAQSESTELTAAEASTAATSTADDANAAARVAEDAHAPELVAAAEGAPNAAANADANTKSSAESRAAPEAAARDKEPALATALPAEDAAEAAAAGTEPESPAEDDAKKADSDAAAPAVGTELKQAVDSAVDSIESALSSSLSKVSSFFKGKGKSKNKLMSSLNKLQEHVKESIEQEKPKAEHHILTSKEPELNLDSVTGPKAQHTLEPELSAVTTQPLVDSAPATSADEPIEPSGAESAAEVAAIAQVAARSANSADSAGLAGAAEAADLSAADDAAAAHEERLARELEALVQEDSASDAATDAVIAALHQGDDHAKTIEVVTPPKPDFDLKSLTIATVAPEPQPEKETEPKVKAAAQPGSEAAAQDVAADTSVSGNTIITRSPVVKPSKAVFISAKEERKVEPEAQAEPENKDRTAQPRPEVNADMVAQLMAEAVEQKFKAHKLAQIDAPRSYQESAQPFADGVYANDINVDLPSSQIFDPTSDTALEADALSQEIQAESSDPLQLPDGNASVTPTVAAATEARTEIQGFAPDADAKLEEASALNQLFAQAQKELQGSAFTRRRHDAAYAAPDLDAPFAPDAPPPEAARADNDSAFYEFAPDRAHAELSADDLIAASAQAPVAPVASAEPAETAPRPVPADFETEIATEVTVATSAESNADSNTAAPTLKRYDPAQAYAQLLLEDDDEYQAARPSVRTSVREQQAQVAAQRAHAKQQALDAATEAALGDMMNDDFAAPSTQVPEAAPRISRTRPGAKGKTKESEQSVSARRAALHRAMYGDEMPQAQASSTKLSATRSSLRSAAPAANTTSNTRKQRGSYIDLNQHGDVVSYNPEAFGQVQRNASTVSASHASGAMTEAANRTAPLAAPFDALAQGTVQGAMQGTVSAAPASTLNFGSSRLSTTRSPINPSTPRATSASASATNTSVSATNTSASNASARRAPLTSNTSATKSSSLTRTSHPHNRFGPNSRLGIMDDDPLVGNAGRSLRPTQRSANTTLRPTSSASATTSAKSTLTRPSPAGVTSTVSAPPASSRPSSLSTSKRPEVARPSSTQARPQNRSTPSAGTKVETLASSNPGVRILRTTSPQQATAPKTVRPRNEVVYSKGGAVVISQRITADQASTFLNQNHESKESHEPTAPTAIAGSTLALRRSAEQSLNTSFKRLQEDKSISGTIVIRSDPNKRK